MPRITVIARRDQGYNHLYGDVRKGQSYEIEEDHFDAKLFKRLSPDDQGGDQVDPQAEVPPDTDVAQSLNPEP